MGGDHKCPLCDATFTRPQHVGRHFRSHTGDRPYQCKECPQAFARSDLLSRHVNKSHRLPEEGVKPSTSKKGRRKSIPTSTLRRPKEPAVTEDVKPKKHVNRNRSASLVDPPRESVQAEPTDHHPALQAQSMYPHHPLLANPDLQTAPIHQAQSSTPWEGYSMSSHQSGPLSTAVPLAVDLNTPIIDTSMQSQFKFPMRLTESDQGIGSSSMGQHSIPSPSYEYVKKRACDQCSHSKVRCDFAEPCQRCSTRNIFCSYTKTPKNRSLSMFPAQRSAYPSSPFRSTTLPINAPSSPLAFTPSPLGGGMLPPTARNSSSPTSVASALLHVPSQMMPNAWSPASVSPGTSAPSPLTQMLQAPRPMMPAQSLPMDTTEMAALNSFSSVNLPMARLAATPSLTSMTTSPSGSDEPFERRGSLPGSMSYSNGRIDPSTGMKGVTQPSMPAPGPVQLQTPIQLPYTQVPQPDLTNYTFGRNEGTLDPRIQFRNPTAVEDEDDMVAPLTAMPHSAIPMNQEDLEDVQQRLHQRRRSSAHIFGFNDMSLGDPNGNGDNPIPDPFTASMVAQEQQRKLYQLHQHMTASGPGNPALAPQNVNWTPEQVAPATGKGEAKELWKAFMEPMADHSNHTGHAQPQGSFISSNPYKDARPEMPARSLSKSSSMPDLQSPIAEPATLNFQPEPPRMRPQDDADAMKRWRSEIRDRQSQSSFSLAPGQSSSGSKMKLDPASFLNAATAARSTSRPMASVLQHSSALEQTLAPERTPSFGLDNVPTPIRAAFASGISSNNSYTGKSALSSLGNHALVPPPSASGWSWKTTSAAARPGNKRLASQTLVGDAPKVGKAGATFGFWDDEDDDTFGGLGAGVGPSEELKVG